MGSPFFAAVPSSCMCSGNSKSFTMHRHGAQSQKKAASFCKISGWMSVDHRAVRSALTGRDATLSNAGNERMLHRGSCGARSKHATRSTKCRPENEEAPSIRPGTLPNMYDCPRGWPFERSRGYFERLAVRVKNVVLEWAASAFAKQTSFRSPSPTWLLCLGNELVDSAQFDRFRFYFVDEDDRRRRWSRQPMIGLASA